MRHPGAWIGAGVFIVGLFVAVFVLGVFKADSPHLTDHPDYPYDEQVFEDLGRSHSPPYEGYNSDPPTSGPHAALADWGVHADPVQKENAIHNMEHGGVVVWYNCEGGPEPLEPVACDDLRAQLASVVQPDVDKGLFVLMTPYSEMQPRIALTAWTILDSFDVFDGERVSSFIASFECRFEQERTCG